MSPSRPGRLVLSLALVAVMGVGCGDDTPSEPDGDGPADPATTTEAADADAEPAATPAGAAGAGEVTVGEQTWTFVPTIQCMVTDSGIAIVSGEALDDPSVEISLDVTPDHGQRFDVTIDDVTMFAQGDEMTATIDGTTVSGSATLSGGAESTEARFDLACG